MNFTFQIWSYFCSLLSFFPRDEIMGSRYQSQPGSEWAGSRTFVLEFKKALAGKLGNSHYFWFYTTYFSLSTNDYQNKSVLDIGCGPREAGMGWDGFPSVGLDPLADHYLKMGSGTQNDLCLCRVRTDSFPLMTPLILSVPLIPLIMLPDWMKLAGDQAGVKTGRTLCWLWMFMTIQPWLNHRLSPGILSRPISLILKFWEKCHLATIHRGHIYRNLRAGKKLPEDSRKTGILTAKLRKIAWHSELPQQFQMKPAICGFSLTSRHPAVPIKF